MSFKAPQVNIPPPVAPTPPAAPPMFGVASPGTKPAAKPTQATFLGGGLFANPANTGQKTLLGT